MIYRRLSPKHDAKKVENRETFPHFLSCEQITVQSQD